MLELKSTVRLLYLVFVLSMASFSGLAVAGEKPVELKSKTTILDLVKMAKDEKKPVNLGTDTGYFSGKIKDMNSELLVIENTDQYTDNISVIKVDKIQSITFSANPHMGAKDK